MRRKILIAVPLLLTAAIALYCIELAVPKRAYFMERAGELTDAKITASSGGAVINETLALESSTGLRVDLRVKRPAASAAGKLPVLLVLGGENTGKDAVDLGGTPDGIAYVAIDYPYTGKRKLKGFWTTAGAIPAIQRAFLDTPPALSLAVDWLLQQDWVDADRIEMVGVSLGVPFAAVCGAMDQRLSRIWLLHGGADNLAWVVHAGRKDIENETLRRWVARGALLLVYGNSFDTARWIDEIAPRPLIIVAAKDDDFVPRDAITPFVEAADSDHVELIWTEGLHINPKRPHELRQLLDIVLDRASP